MKRFAVMVLPIGLLLLWTVLTASQIVDEIFLPTPWAVAESVVGGLLSGELAKDVAVTLLRSMAGFAVAAIIGVPIGLLIGRVPVLADATQPTIDFFRSIPATALFPFFLFLFGIGNEAKIAIVVYACSLTILVNTAYGAIQVKKSRILCAQVLGATRWDIFWRIVVPEAATGIFAGLRVALSMAFVLVIVTEMFIGTTVGLGYRIMDSQMVYRTAEMYGGIVLAGILGYLANWVLVKIEKRSLHWVGR